MISSIQIVVHVQSDSKENLLVLDITSLLTDVILESDILFSL